MRTCNTRRRGAVALSAAVAITTLLGTSVGLTGCNQQEEEEVIELRVANWEEYIDEGDWDEEETIDLEDGVEIIGENSMVDDFEEWFYETYGKRVKVSYSTFGTCEELYNQLTIGDEFDVACPSEYMIMKMLREGMLLPYSEHFYDTTDPNNYYTNGVSPFISAEFQNLSISGYTLDQYAAGYMWGTLGNVYNPEEVTEEEASHFNLLWNTDFNRRVTIKDSVRDTYFAALGVAYYDEITSEEFLNAPDYKERLTEVLNRTDEDTVDLVEDLLSQAKDNVYSFETDSGKADMVTGKVVANLQWSGDAVYTMDQAEEDGMELCYAAPTECTNLWFDGWILLKGGIGEDADKQLAAEAWVNYLSKPENAIRNMYYIGYTSTIAGGDSDLIYQYLQWNYGAEEDEEDVVDYSVATFFTGSEDADPDQYYTFEVPESQTRRQLYAQYPPADVLDRAVIMQCFDEADNERINRMWTNVRCFNLQQFFTNLWK